MLPIIVPMNVSGNREQMRRQVVTAFLDEAPGTGNGDNTSRYEYEVEQVTTGGTIILRRPAPLNKGFDFEVHVVGGYFPLSRIKTRPTHPGIYADLSAKKEENPTEYEIVAALIEDMYLCHPIPDTELNQFQFRSGNTVEQILKAIKWLFIEQDVTYWNWSGRDMFIRGLRGI